MQNHLQPVDVKYGENSIAYCSYLPPKNLVIFVHGFSGHAVNTWNDFPELIQKHSKFKETDVIFYGYDSLKTQASNMKLRLYKLLDNAFRPSNMTYSSARSLPADFNYEKIIIVAHSLGAVVTRLALIYARSKKAIWLDKCSMLLFAPAHFGSRVPDNFKECFIGLAASLFKSFAATKYPIIKDLTEGSTILSQLEQTTRKILDEGNAVYAKAKKVVWASNDIVVINNTYCDDDPEDEIDNTSHISVCKPHAGNSHEPFNHLLQIM